MSNTMVGESLHKHTGKSLRVLKKYKGTKHQSFNYLKNITSKIIIK